MRRWLALIGSLICLLVLLLVFWHRDRKAVVGNLRRLGWSSWLIGVAVYLSSFPRGAGAGNSCCQNQGGAVAAFPAMGMDKSMGLAFGGATHAAQFIPTTLMGATLAASSGIALAKPLPFEK